MAVLIADSPAEMSVLRELKVAYLQPVAAQGILPQLARCMEASTDSVHREHVFYEHHPKVVL